MRMDRTTPGTPALVFLFAAPVSSSRSTRLIWCWKHHVARSTTRNARWECTIFRKPMHSVPASVQNPHIRRQPLTPELSQFGQPINFNWYSTTA